MGERYLLKYFTRTHQVVEEEVHNTQKDGRTNSQLNWAARAV